MFIIQYVRLERIEMLVKTELNFMVIASDDMGVFYSCYTIDARYM